ncbi:MAG: polyprenyl synthetase family protein [Candidatus Omnitrophota bacterium]
MINKIKRKLTNELRKTLKNINSHYFLKSNSPILINSLNNFLSKPGKLIRPILFVLGYLGFAKKEKSGLYKSAISMEFLHDFMLIHDDIIDKSDTRRGAPSMHKTFSNHISKYRNIKFNGQDLSILAGDIIYSIAIDIFLSIKENPYRKEQALKKLMQTAVYTGIGEFIELMSGTKNIDQVKKNDIYKIYDFKTAYYSFSCPLSCGAILAGAKQKQIELIWKYGTYLGRAFQIKDDIQGLFFEEKITGKSSLVDLKESKKTLIIWLTSKLSGPREKNIIKNILKKHNVSQSDLYSVKEIINNSGAKAIAEKEILMLYKKATSLIKLLKINTLYKQYLCNYAKEIILQ